MGEAKRRYVVAIVRTPNGGWARVIFGNLVEQKEKLIVLSEARQAIYYDAQTGGELGLAAHGPAGACRISAVVNRVELSGFEGLLMDCEDAAIQAWRTYAVFRG